MFAHMGSSNKFVENKLVSWTYKKQNVSKGENNDK